MIRRALPVVLAWLGLMIAGGGEAMAQNYALVTRQIQLQHRGCIIRDPREVYRGTIEGIAQPIMLVTYILEGCDGSQAWRPTFAVYHEDQRGQLVSLRITPEARLLARSARVEGSRLEVTGMDFARTDPRCCPSQRRTVAYALRGNQLTAIR